MDSMLQTMADNELKKVIEPTPPDFMNEFTWDDPELQKWVKTAIKMQAHHVAKNHDTEYFQFKRSSFDAVQLRICIILFGMKVNFASCSSSKVLEIPSLHFV